MYFGEIPFLAFPGILPPLYKPGEAQREIDLPDPGGSIHRSSEGVAPGVARNTT